MADATAKPKSHAVVYDIQIEFQEKLHHECGVVWHFDLEEPGSLSLQVSKMHLNRVMTDIMFMGILLQEQG